MGIKHYRPYTPSRRNMTSSTYEESQKRHQKNLYLQQREKMQVEIHMVELQ